MKVLWFTNTPSGYLQSHNYNGGGWISSLENKIKKTCPEVDLGVAFYYDLGFNGWQKVDGDGVVYYPMMRPRQTLFSHARQLLGGRLNASLAHEKLTIPQFLEIVRDFNPDIIHIFGSENTFGLLSKYTNIPVVMHIQGVLSACVNSFLPPGISWNNYMFSTLGLKSLMWHLRERLSFERNSITEVRMFRNIKYFMGRTHWDKLIINLLNPSAQYFTCNEMLRDSFYAPLKREESHKHIFISVLSWQIYKGYDLVLKTANLLKEVIDSDFEWHIYGNVNPKFIEKKFNLLSKNTSIVFKGVVTPDKLSNALLSATALIHPSYIENSSNVICEAQILGCPCVATNVGGTSSLIEQGITGLLVPSNDPYALAYNIKYLMENNDLRVKLSRNAYIVARDRHDRDKIVEQVIDVYQTIMDEYANSR